MQQPEQNEDEHIHDPRTENEIKKIKLALEYGMDFSESFTNPDLPAETEGQFLDYIQKWEEQYSQRKLISIYDLAGKPDFKPLDKIPDNEIEDELGQLMGKLQAHAIVLDTLCEVDDKELYRFITEEFFNHETDDIRIEGMTHCFTYEDFHQNHEYDINNRCKEFVDFVLDKREDVMESWCLADNIRTGEKEYTKSEFAEKLALFRDSFSAFTLRKYEITSIILNEASDDAKAIYDLYYTGIVEGSHDNVEFKGACTLWLQRNSEWWSVYKFDMPGVVIS